MAAKLAIKWSPSELNAATAAVKGVRGRAERAAALTAAGIDFAALGGLGQDAGDTARAIAEVFEDALSVLARRQSEIGQRMITDAMVRKGRDPSEYVGFVEGLDGKLNDFPQPYPDVMTDMRRGKNVKLNSVVDISVGKASKRVPISFGMVPFGRVSLFRKASLSLAVLQDIVLELMRRAAPHYQTGRYESSYRILRKLNGQQWEIPASIPESAQVGDIYAIVNVQPYASTLERHAFDKNGGIMFYVAKNTEARRKGAQGAGGGAEVGFTYFQPGSPQMSLILGQNPSAKTQYAYPAIYVAPLGTKLPGIESKPGHERGKTAWYRLRPRDRRERKGGRAGKKPHGVKVRR